MSGGPGFDGHRPPDPALIADCVHCGFCLPACPTYVLWGEEMDSPRGRIHLMKQGHEGAALSDRFARHIDLCLGCLACETACPSGVRYGRLLESTRQQLERRHPRPPVERVQRGLLFFFLPHPARLSLARAGLALASRLGVTAALRQPRVQRWLPARVRALVSLLPDLRASEPLPRWTPSQGEQRRRVALLAGCVQGAFFSHVNAASVRVLAAEGCAVELPAGQGCCGALSLHAGREPEALALARNTIAAFEAAECVVVTSAGCGAAMKGYGELLRDDAAWAARAERFAAKVRDFCEVLSELGSRAPRHPLRLRAAYHDACHLSHGQGIRRAPRELLLGVPGLELCEIADPELCCGSAGTYNLLQPEAARALGDRKAAQLAESGAEAIVSSNPGCLLQLRAALVRAGRPLPLVHLAELLDGAIRGSGVEGLPARGYEPGTIPGKT